MALHPVTVVSNDERAAKLTGAARHEQREIGSDETKVYVDPLGIVAIIGRGESDPNVTYFALKNTNGDTVYCYPNAAGDGLLFSTSVP
jgi:hypothetical protein